MSGKSDQKVTSLRMRFDEPESGSSTDVAARRQQNTVNVSRYKHARILFPALGFPAMIAPGSGASGNERDPSRCLTLLILSRRPLSKADVARHLRWVPWNQRHTRWLPDAEHGGTNAFREEEIEVRGNILSESQGRMFPRYFGQDRHTQLYTAAGDDEGYGGMGLGLSRDVRRFYWRRGMRHMNEVRIYESACTRLPEGMLNLFWINPNRSDDENDRSQEMDLLLEEFAVSSRFGHDGIPSIDKFVGKTREGQKRRFIREYEYEFNRPESGATRVEVLHPVWVTQPQPRLRIGHLTDLHVDIRHDSYYRKLSPAARKRFHNWNRVCEKLYADAKKSCDILLLTGDLIDYGRGHNGFGAIGKNESYWRDRNWFLFYTFLAGGGSYTKPTYTILGNHDWRINPYAAFAPGAPSPESMKLTKDELRLAHGDGADRKWYEEDDTNWIGGMKEKLIDRDGELDVGGTPLETTVDSVLWYLLLINPFLDFTSRLPGEYELLMLDWGEDEEVDRTVVSQGVDLGRTPLIPNTEGGPVAKNCLNSNQATLLKLVARQPGKAKIVGIHAPPVGPWPQWPDDEMLSGRVSYDPKKKNRGTAGGRVIQREGDINDPARYREWEIHDHEIYAVATTHNPAGREADYGSIGGYRRWMIRKLRAEKFTLVLAGHIHRPNVLQLEDSGIQNGPIYVKGVRPSDADKAPTPLFVNTTSAGPLGSTYPRPGVTKLAESGYTEIVVSSSGKIESVEFMTDKGKLQPQDALSIW